MLAATVNGVVVLDGKTGAVITTLQGDTGFQNSPLVTDDPDGTVGITLAGYQSGGSSSITTRSPVPTDPWSTRPEPGLSSTTTPN